MKVIKQPIICYINVSISSGTILNIYHMCKMFLYFPCILIFERIYVCYKYLVTSAYVFSLVSNFTNIITTVSVFHCITNVSCNTHNVCIQASYDKFLLFCDKCSKTWTIVCLTSKRKERCVHLLHIIHIRYHECIRQFVLSPTVPTSGSYITTTNEGSSIRRNFQWNVLYYKTWNVFIAKSFQVVLTRI